MMKFNVVVKCPIHDKEVILTVPAPDVVKAKEAALGTRVACPWGPIDKEFHIFIVEHVLEVFEEWKPPAVLVGPERKLGVITSMVEVPEIIPVVPKPPEALYVMPSRVAERISTKLMWWKPEEYRKEAKKLQEEWRKKIMESFKEHQDKWGAAQAEYSRRTAEARRIPDVAERERKLREAEEWRLAREKELAEGLKLVYERVATPPDAIGVMDEEMVKLVREMEKRLKMRLI